MQRPAILSPFRPDAADGSLRTVPSASAWLLLLPILAAVLAIRLASLAVSATELGFDEAQYWSWSQEPAFGYFSKPPMIAWIIGVAGAVCGDGAACVRAPAAIFHTGTAFLVFALARQIYDDVTGFWSAVMYALMPGVAISSALMTTDAPLLFFWVAAMLAYVLHIARPSRATGMLLGLAVGLGLNAKYAMIYFPLAVAMHIGASPPLRSLARAGGTWLALGVATLLIAPNIGWNAANSFVTLWHTSDNIGSLVPDMRPDQALEFLAAQFGLLGPVVFGGFLYLLATGRRTGKSASDRLLLFFSLPIVLLVVAQALRAEANGNWAATAFPAIIIWTTAFVISDGWRTTFRISLALNGMVCAGFAIGFAFVDPQSPHMPRLVQQVGGWQDFARAVDDIAAPSGVATIVADGRVLTAELLHALRDGTYEVRALRRPHTGIDDHFKLTRPWEPGMAGPVILVSANLPPEGVWSAEELGVIWPRGYLERSGPYRVWRIGAP